MRGGIRLIFPGLLALGCFTLAVWVGWYYPIPIWPLAAALICYAAALWRWPALFLVVVPATLPALDLGILTGWTMIGESDLVVLTSIGVLLCRGPPSWPDLFPRGRAGVVLLFLIASFGISAIIGVSTVIQEGPLSDNPYLRPDNALRLIKPLAEALALLPFMRHRQREHGDVAAWLGWGMVAGVSAVALETIAERAAFPGLFDFTSDYRVTAAFYSMHIGGGHIGAYIAMSVPFFFGAALTTRRWYTRVVLLPLASAATYALVVTFARTAYAAGFASLLTALFAWLALRPRDSSGRARWLVPLLLFIPVAGGLLMAASSGYMRERFGHSSSDLVTRELNWRNGWALHDSGIWHFTIGMGLGTYPRLNLAQAAGDKPGDFRLVGNGENRYLTMTSMSPLYIGQKIFFRPSGPLRLEFRWRASSADATAGISICEKILLYSDNCRGRTVTSHAPGTWEAVSIVLSTDGLGAKAVHGLPARPMELSLFNATPGTTIAFNGLTLTDARGREILANGNFKDGMTRWGFSNDDHLVWRMKNLYLMLIFETGLLGSFSFSVLCVGAALGGARAIRLDDAMGAALIGAIISFLISGLFDNLFEAPRLATVFLLVCAGGLISWELKNHSWVRDPRRPAATAEWPTTPNIGTPIGEIERY
jgi:hypothetical protein